MPTATTLDAHWETRKIALLAAPVGWKHHLPRTTATAEMRPAARQVTGERVRAQ